MCIGAAAAALTQRTCFRSDLPEEEVDDKQIKPRGVFTETLLVPNAATDFFPLYRL